MQQMTRDLIIAAALVVMAVAARAAEPQAPSAAPAAEHDTAAARVVRPARDTRSNLDPLRGPVATSPRAYPYDAVEMQPAHSWRGYAEN